MPVRSHCSPANLTAVKSCESGPLAHVQLMNIAPDSQLDAAEKPAEPQPAPRAKRMRGKRSKWTPKPRPISRDQLDGRLAAAKLFDAQVRDIAAELGGDLSKIELSIVEGLVGAQVGLSGQIAQLCQGKPIDWSVYCGTLSTLVRAASRLGPPWRRPKLIDRVPSLAQYLNAKAEREDVS